MVTLERTTSVRRLSFVARPALFQRLLTGYAGGVTLVSAPAGSGKTVLMRSWIAEAGLVFSGLSPDRNLVEYVELPRDVHPYYIATQAHPELRSRPTDPHPLFRGLVSAALERHRSSELFDVDNG